MRDTFSPGFAYCPLQVIYHVLDTSRNPQTTSEKHLDDLQATFDEGRKKWEASKDCKKMQAAAENAPALTDITKIVAFACGDFCDERKPYQKWRLESIKQHAAILTLRDLLRSKSPAGSEFDVQCFAQDPAYTDNDREVLQRVGITVLGDPRAFCEVDEHSIVLSFAADAPVRQIVIDIARPAMMIWDRVMNEQETLDYWREDRCLEVVDDHRLDKSEEELLDLEASL